MDVHISLTLAARDEILTMFRFFYGGSNAKQEATQTLPLIDSSDTAEDTALVSTSVILADPDNLDKLAIQFASAIPGGVFSMAQLIGYLLGYKDDPADAVSHVSELVGQHKSEALSEPLPSD
jgi:chaperone BCS1